MNERIKLLAEQAEQSVNWGDPNNYDSYKQAMDEWQEKFAELIVRECAELNFRELGLSGSVSFEVSRMIKHHFGVEI